MSLVDSVRKVIVPIHKEGYVFIAIGLVATIILANLWSPFGWIGAIITVWICYFFRDPVRIVPQREGLVISPADGRISQAGPIRAGRVFQAKGQDFSVAELLGDEAAAAPYADGRFATVYLSPRDYHRVHMPLAGELVETLHVPGRLFSVAPFAVEAIPRLFARNERLVSLFRTADGPFAVVLVGAMLVSGIETAWGGVEVPPHARRIMRRDWRGRGVHLARGQEMGRFNMGSTVIVLLPAALGRFDPGLRVEQPVQMGERVGRRNPGHNVTAVDKL